jgi:hypothetical protein
MQLIFRDGKKYEPTAEDKLWLARAVQAEGPVASQVARALVNGFGVTYAHGTYKTLKDFVRAYAQPVNPRWFPDGDLFLKHAGGVPTAAQLAIAQKRRDVHSTRTKFSAETKDAVKQALETPFSSDVTDYAAAKLDASKKGMTARSDATQGENRLWTRLPGWPGYSVTGAAGGLGTLVAIALAFYLATRKS